MRGALAVMFLLVATATSQAQQPGWDIRVPERVEVVMGASVPVPIAIAVDRGLTVSKDAPVIVDLVVDGAGVSTKKRRLGRTDAVDPDADAPRFSVPFKGEAVGEHAIKIRVRLWLCGGKVCRPLDVRRQTTLVVTASGS